MTGFWAFADNHPFLAIIVLWCMIGCPLRILLIMYNRTLRSRHILKHGWPTAPVDADGDVVYRRKE